MDMYIKALNFAAAAHAGQTRKRTGLPYILHPVRVARIVSQEKAFQDFDVAVQAALLHDTLEDTKTTGDDLRREFGETVAGLVLSVTNPPENRDWPRGVRVRGRIDHLKDASFIGKLLKMADRLDNLRDSDPEDDFTHLYAKETLLMLEAIGGTVTELEADLGSLARKLA